jgi:ribosomal protein S27E
MALELACPGCGRTLQVADEHAGKQIRCPACHQISIAPQKSGTGETSPADITGGDQATKWLMRTPEGPIYGPISWDDVLAWASEGRIAADCQLAESREGPWRDAAELLDLRPATGPQPAAPRGPTTYPWTGAETLGLGNTAGPITSPYAPVSGYVAPHRGGLVLALGLLGCFTCPFFSLVAWVMGSHDLREMRAGRMDRSGESPTMAGMILGMILSLLWIISAMLFLTVILIAMAARL